VTAASLVVPLADSTGPRLAVSARSPQDVPHLTRRRWRSSGATTVLCSSPPLRASKVLMSPAHRGKFVSYLRVSTDKQGADGYGIEAQRSAVATYLNGGAWTMLKEFVAVESGKVNARPQLENSTSAR
jgi:Resolvase, N terminal domain